MKCIEFATRFDLSDAEYALLAPFFPPEHSGKAGRPWASHRKTLDGIFWILRTGAPWRDLPACYGPFSTVHNRLTRWRQNGLWRKMLDKLQSMARRLGRIDFSMGDLDGSVVRAHKAAAGARKGADQSPEQSRQNQALGQSRGGMTTKIHVLSEGQGKHITGLITPGQEAEVQQAEKLLDAVAIGGKPGPPRRRFERIGGDKGYDSEPLRQGVRRRGSRPVIAYRKLKDGTYPARAKNFDKQAYRRRSVVECLFGRLKEWRSIATRYAKLGQNFLALILLGFIRIWVIDLLRYRP